MNGRKLVAMTYANQERRPGVIRGLRELAALLESCPDIPAPYTVNVLVFPPIGMDSAIFAEVRRVAALLGVAVQDDTAQHAHYTASKSFGPVSYEAIAIPSRTRAYHEAQNSYAGNVMPGHDEEASE
jgi:hypothetical protein